MSQRPRRGYLSRIGMSVVLMVAGASSALALTDEELFRQFEFNFTNPGARALGMGGAYLAAASDVTAAAANPAALHHLAGPEVFFEYRSIDTDTLIESDRLGSLDVDPLTGERELPFLGLDAVSATKTMEEPTFVGLAWPLNPGGRRLTLAASRQVVLSQERSLVSGDNQTRARFSFDTFPNTVSGSVTEAYSVATSVTGDSSMEIVYWSGSASLDAHPDFSVGLTVSYGTLDMAANTTTTVEDPLELFLDPTHPRLPPQTTADLSRTVIDDDDFDVTYSIGVDWHPDSVFASGSSPWRFGAVFRKGARFSVRQSTFLNDVADRTLKNKIVVPDRASVGLSYTTRGPWRFTLEFERIEYSDMLEDFQSGINVLTSGRIADGAFGIDDDETIEYKADDGNLPRGGAEYVRSIRGGKRLAFRAGYYRNPDGRIRMIRFNSDDEEVNQTYLDAFRGGEDEDHVTGGFGLTVGRSSINIAIDTSDAGSQILGSYTFAFKE